MRDQARVIGFATAVCLVCSVLLALVSSGLAPRQARNKAQDVKTKVLHVFGVAVTDANGKPALSAEEIDRIFEARITGTVLDSEGRVVTDRTVASLSAIEMNDRDSVTERKAFYPLYTYTDPLSGTTQVAIHLSGKGLWSTVKAFMALESDYSTIAGIVFYEHQETPGLGGEIDKPYFQARFVGKQWTANGERRTLRIPKPGMAEGRHAVDGITAATMTCRGIEEFINADYAVYYRYFEKLKAAN